MPKKKGKKSAGKKAKKTAQKESESGAAVYKLPPKTPEEAGEAMLRKTRHWLQECFPVVKKFLDAYGREQMASEEIATAMRHLQAPLSSDELQWLLQQLDSSGMGVVKIRDLYNVSQLSDQEIVRRACKAVEDLLVKQAAATMQASEEEKGKKEGKKGKGKAQKKESKPEMSARGIVQCSRCGIPLCEPMQETEPRYVMLQLTLATFKDMPKHPGHFTVLVLDSASIEGIRELIKTHLEGSTYSLALFDSPKCTRGSYLPSSYTLEECGVVGRSRDQPTPFQLFYDYMPIVVDCPILMSDTAMRNITV